MPSWGIRGNLPGHLGRGPFLLSIHSVNKYGLKYAQESVVEIKDVKSRPLPLERMLEHRQWPGGGQPACPMAMN